MSENISAEAEPAEWQLVYDDGSVSRSVYTKSEANDYERRSASVVAIRPLYTAPTAPPVAVKALDLDAVYVIPREMTDEEWSEVKYNVDRKANPDIELWRIKDAVRYANFIAGHRGRSTLSAQVAAE